MSIFKMFVLIFSFILLSIVSSYDECIIPSINSDDFSLDYNFTNAYFTIYDVEQCKNSPQGCYITINIWFNNVLLI